MCIRDSHAHYLEAWSGGDERAATRMWLSALTLYALLVPVLYFETALLGVGLFVLLHLLQNLWRPVLVGRLNAVSAPELGATTLSIESQAKSAYVVVAAPLAGLAADRVGLWPVALMGALIACTAVAVRSGPARSGGCLPEQYERQDGEERVGEPSGEER